MQRISRDTIATALIALLIVTYAGYLLFDRLPFLRDVKSMAKELR